MIEIDCSPVFEHEVDEALHARLAVVRS